jgi:amidase
VAGGAATFITTLDPAPGPGLRLAVKDLIDIEGLPTTAGCRPVAERARPAGADAPCLAGARAAGARIVGKANLVELAFGASGVNPWSGTPVNPLDPRLVPGGSSSGSAVAVATDEADVAYGSDTGGSIRIPSAFCGTAGLKTTYGRVSLAGVWPLASSLDTVGPMARDVAGLVRGMELLEPGFSVPMGQVTHVGRVRAPGVAVHPDIDAAVDRALRAAELTVSEDQFDDWEMAYRHAADLLEHEAAVANRALLDDAAARAGISAAVLDRLERGAMVTPAAVAAARTYRVRWATRLGDVVDRYGLLALPTAPIFPPRLEDAHTVGSYTSFTVPVNLAGLPALSVPVPTGGPLPAGLQLIGPPGSEGLLLVAGLRIEAAVAASM